MSKIDNFPSLTPVPAKIWGCSLWSRSVMLGSAESEEVRLISRKLGPLLIESDVKTAGSCKGTNIKVCKNTRVDSA